MNKHLLQTAALLCMIALLTGCASGSSAPAETGPDQTTQTGASATDGGSAGTASNTNDNTSDEDRLFFDCGYTGLSCAQVDPHLIDWFNASYAILSKSNQLKWYMIGGLDEHFTLRDIFATHKEGVAQSWGVSDHDSAVEQIESLMQEADNDQHAFNLVRAMQLIGFSYTFGYFDFDEYLGRSLACGRTMQRLYGSWDELLSAYLDGFEDWSKERNTDPSFLESRKEYHEQWLLDAEDYGVGPYALDYHTDLSVKESDVEAGKGYDFAATLQGLSFRMNKEDYGNYGADYPFEYYEEHEEELGDTIQRFQVSDPAVSVLGWCWIQDNPYFLFTALTDKEQLADEEWIRNYYTDRGLWQTSRGIQFKIYDDYTVLVHGRDRVSEIFGGHFFTVRYLVFPRDPDEKRFYVFVFEYEEEVHKMKVTEKQYDITMEALYGLIPEARDDGFFFTYEELVKEMKSFHDNFEEDGE